MASNSRLAISSLVHVAGGLAFFVCDIHLHPVEISYIDIMMVSAGAMATFIALQNFTVFILFKISVSLTVMHIFSLV